MNLTETLREPEGKTLEFKRNGHMTPACAAGGRWPVVDGSGPGFELDRDAVARAAEIHRTTR